MMRKNSCRPLALPVICLFALDLALVAQTAVPQPPSERAAVRFLQQCTFGPTPDLIAHVRALGFDGFLEEQFALLPSLYPNPVPDSTGKTHWLPTQQHFFVNAVSGPDQVRQRMAWALLEMWVVSGVKLNRPEQMLPYVRMMESDAFGHFRTLMGDVTLSPAMGHYLDMVNNNKPTSGKGANENYSREVLQLFTIGLEKLNPDGSPQPGANGQPVATYDQEVIEELARVFTGWTYAPLPGATSKWTNPANWDAPMVAFEGHHDPLPKNLFNGIVIPGGQSAETDLRQALDAIYHHPNVAPFISRNLIQHFVTGQPSAQFVQDVAATFIASDGDLKQVLRAILLHPEARAGDDSPAPASFDGQLREPALYVTGLVRALGATVEENNGLAGVANGLGQNVFFPPTVFSYYAPSYSIPKTTINAPEFQLDSGSLAMARADFVNRLVYGKIAGVTVDLSPFIALAAAPVSLLNHVDALFLHGSMDTQMRSVLTTAIGAQPNAKGIAQTALYLAGSSQQYQVTR